MSHFLTAISLAQMHALAFAVVERALPAKSRGAELVFYPPPPELPAAATPAAPPGVPARTA